MPFLSPGPTPNFPPALTRHEAQLPRASAPARVRSPARSRPTDRAAPFVSQRTHLLALGRSPVHPALRLTSLSHAPAPSPPFLSSSSRWDSSALFRVARAATPLSRGLPQLRRPTGHQHPRSHLLEAISRAPVIAGRCSRSIFLGQNPRRTSPRSPALAFLRRAPRSPALPSLNPAPRLLRRILPSCAAPNPKHVVPHLATPCHRSTPPRPRRRGHAAPLQHRPPRAPQ